MSDTNRPELPEGWFWAAGNAAALGGASARIRNGFLAAESGVSDSWVPIAVVVALLRHAGYEVKEPTP